MLCRSYAAAGQMDSAFSWKFSAFSQYYPAMPDPAPQQPFPLPSSFPVRVIERSGLHGRVPQHMAHRHRPCEITAVRRGRTLYQVGDTEYPLGPGDVLVVGELQNHEWRELDEDEGSKTVILFDPDLLRWTGRVPSGALIGSDEATALIDRVVRELEAMQPGFGTIVVAALERILLLTERETVSLSGLVRRGLSFLRTHASEAISVTDIAAASGVSAAHMRNVWRRELGVAPSRVLRETRAGLAAGLLGSGALSVTAVASAAGYGSISALERAFRSVYGCSPREFARGPRERRSEHHPVSSDLS